jgi:hypothetical protein
LNWTDAPVNFWPGKGFQDQVSRPVDFFADLFYSHWFIPVYKQDFENGIDYRIMFINKPGLL